MLLPEADALATKPEPHTKAGWPAASPFVSPHFALAANAAAQLPVVVTAQSAVVVPAMRVQVAVVAWPAPKQVAVQVEPTVVGQFVAQLALATPARGTPRQRTAGRQHGKAFNMCRAIHCAWL